MREITLWVLSKACQRFIDLGLSSPKVSTPLYNFLSLFFALIQILGNGIETAIA
jgi:hypothetical protein